MKEYTTYTQRAIDLECCHVQYVLEEFSTAQSCLAWIGVFGHGASGNGDGSP